MTEVRPGAPVPENPRTPQAAKPLSPIEQQRADRAAAQAAALEKQKETRAAAVAAQQEALKKRQEDMAAARAAQQKALADRQAAAKEAAAQAAAARTGQPCLPPHAYSTANCTASRAKTTASGEAHSPPVLKTRRSTPRMGSKNWPGRRLKGWTQHANVQPATSLDQNSLVPAERFAAVRYCPFWNRANPWSADQQPPPSLRRSTIDIW